MKVHDNTGFQGVRIVLRSPAKYFKSNSFVEPSSGPVGLANLEKDPIAHVCEERRNELSCDPFSTACRSNGEIQDLHFIGRDTAGDEKSDDLAVELGDRHVISRGIPGGRLGTGALDRGDGIAVAVDCGAEEHYFFGA